MKHFFSLIPSIFNLKLKLIKQQVILEYRTCDIGAADSWFWTCTERGRWSVMNTVCCSALGSNRKHVFAPTFSNILHTRWRHPAANPVPPLYQSPPFDWNMALHWFQMSLLVPIRGSVPIKIWDIAGLSFWYFHSGDFFLKNSREVQTTWGCSQCTSGVHTPLVSLECDWRQTLCRVRHFDAL